MSAARDLAHQSRPPLVLPPREHDGSYAPRYRFADAKRRIKG